MASDGTAPVGNDGDADPPTIGVSIAKMASNPTPVTPNASAILFCPQPACLSSQARSRRPSRQLCAVSLSFSSIPPILPLTTSSLATTQRCYILTQCNHVVSGLRSPKGQAVVL